MQHKSAALESCVVILSPITAVQREPRMLLKNSTSLGPHRQRVEKWVEFPHRNFHDNSLVVVVWKSEYKSNENFQAFCFSFQASTAYFWLLCDDFQWKSLTLLSFQCSVFSFCSDFCVFCWLLDSLCLLLRDDILIGFGAASRELQRDNEDDFELITIFSAINWAGEGWKNKIKKA